MSLLFTVTTTPGLESGSLFTQFMRVNKDPDSNPGVVVTIDVSITLEFNVL